MTEEAAVARRSGSGWKLALRLAISGAFLVVLYIKAPNFEDVLPDRHHGVTLLLVIAAILVALLGVVLSAWRWQRVLVLLDASVGLFTLTSIYLAGLFFGNVMPSTIGGDVLRVARAGTIVGDNSTSFASVALERLTGFVALPLLVVTGFALEPSLIHRKHAWIALLVAGITVVFLGIVLFLAGHPRVAGRYAEHEGWMRFIGAVHRGVDRLRRDPRQIVPILGTALLYQLSVVLMFGIIFRALDLPVPIAAVMAFSPAVLMLQVLPISLGGIGVREASLVLFLHAFLHGSELKDSRIIAAGLLWYFCMLVVSLLGAPAFAIGNRDRGAPQRAGEHA